MIFNARLRAEMPKSVLLILILPLSAADSSQFLFVNLGHGFLRVCGRLQSNIADLSVLRDIREAMMSRTRDCS